MDDNSHSNNSAINSKPTEIFNRLREGNHSSSNNQATGTKGSSSNMID